MFLIEFIDNETRFRLLVIEFYSLVIEFIDNEIELQDSEIEFCCLVIEFYRIENKLFFLSF